MIRPVPAFLLLAACAALTPARAITLQQEVELYSAIISLDRGAVKVIDAKPQEVSFTFSAATRFTLAMDAQVLKSRSEAYQAAAVATRGQLDPKGLNDNSSQAALSAALTPIFEKDDPKPPELQKVALADLNLDANPIPIDTLAKLRLIIQP